MEEQSKGHIGYSSNGLYEYFVCGQNIYKAHRTCVLDVNTGYRLGANYVCRVGHWLKYNSPLGSIG